MRSSRATSKKEEKKEVEKKTDEEERKKDEKNKDEKKIDEKKIDQKKTDKDRDVSPSDSDRDSKENKSNKTRGKGHSTTCHEDKKKSPRHAESNPSEKKTTKEEKSTKEGKANKEDKSESSKKEEKPAKQEGATPRRSPNKIYRTPPTPAPVELFVRERSFTLDCIAVNTTSNDYARAKPKLGQVIRPYNSQSDKNIEAYFKFLGIDRTLKKTGQTNPGTSIEGPVVDRFFESGAGYRYLSSRNKHGCGRSSEEADGHAQFMNDIKPVLGFNGKYGYRRNNPWLRYQPSPFGVGTASPIH